MLLCTIRRRARKEDRQEQSMPVHRGIKKRIEIKNLVVICRYLGYNKINLECSIKSCYFEPTDTLNGIPILSYGCHASGLYALCSGRQKYGCGYPPSLARSQNTRFGISGNTKDKEQSFHATAFVVTMHIRMAHEIFVVRI